METLFNRIVPPYIFSLDLRISLVLAVEPFHAHPCYTTLTIDMGSFVTDERDDPRKSVE